MSGGGAADDAEDLARARSEARAGESFDAREQVKSGAAYELHCRATADSAVDDHPGFVPDAYLDGLGTGTAVMAAELCSAGVWERAEGGYRILDRAAVGRCQDLARQLSGEAARVRARIRAGDHARAQLMPQMARAMVVTPPCAACGAPATRIELVAAGQLPARWEHWPRTVRDSFRRHRGPAQWYLIFDGVATGLHQLDGARYLRDAQHADAMVCRLVAHHSCAIIEAGERGLAGILSSEFDPAPYALASVLTCGDMTTSPDGQPVPVDRRLAEIHDRYGSGHLVSRSIQRATPMILRAVEQVHQRAAQTA